MELRNQTKLVLYIVALVLVILSKIIGFPSYNVAMSIAALLLVASLIIDALQYYKEKRIFKMWFYIAGSLFFCLSVSYIWIFVL